MKKKAIRQCTVFVLVLAMFCSMVPVSVKATESKKTVQAGKKVIVKKNVTVGKQLNISISGKEVTYKSSNSSVASVSSEGIVTGKKQGETEISVKKAGKKTTYYQITVKPRNNRPELPVALDEVKLVSASLKKLQNNEMQYSARVKNMAKKGTVRKIVYYYSITGKDTAEAETQVAGQEKAETQAAGVKKTVTLTAKKIKAGATSNVVSCEGDISGDVSKMKLQKVKLYTGEALYTYNVQKNKAALTWGTADKKAPVFSGWIGKNSYCGKDMFRICYTDRKQQYNFKKYVTAYDERDGKVKFSVDTRKINWKKEGVYKIKYTAKDKAGNKATAWAKVRVYKPSTAEAIADEVLRSTIKPGWSDEKKLRAIYKYIKKHCSYVDANTHKDWRKTAIKGIRYQSGDCFMYYSISRLLISRAGIPNIMVRRYPAPANHQHWWNLVYVRGGWYHFDTTPRSRPGTFCLVTDAQLRSYATDYTFRFRKNYYPKRATKKISPNP